MLMHKKYALMAISVILITMLTISTFTVFLGMNNTKKYLEKQNYPFRVEESRKSPFSKIQPKLMKTMDSDYKTYDEQGVYELEWSVAPGGYLKAIAKAEFSDGLGYVSIEGNKIRAYSGASLTTLKWEYIDENAIYLVAGDIDNDGYTEIGVVDRTRVYIIGDNGVPGATYQLSSSVSGYIVGGALVGNYPNNNFVAVSSYGQLIVWGDKSANMISISGSVSLVAFSSQYVFIARGSTLSVYDSAGNYVGGSSFSTEIVALNAKDLSGGTYVSVAVGREIKLLSFDGASFAEIWSVYLPSTPRAIDLLEYGGNINVYVVLADRIVRIVYGFELNSVEIPIRIDGMFIDDINGGAPEEIVVYSREGSVLVYDYTLSLTKRCSVGDGLKYVLVDGSALRVIMAKEFEVVVGSVVLGEENINIDNRRLTGNQFYASLIYKDTNDVMRIVAGGADGKLYFLSLDGVILDSIELGGNITQIIEFRQESTKTWFAVNNGSLVFVSDNADIVKSYGDGSTRMKIGVGTFKESVGVIMLYGLSLYYVGGPATPTPESISDLTYKDFVIVNIDGTGDDEVVAANDAGTQLVVIKAEYVSGSYVWSDETTVSAPYTVVDLVALGGSSRDYVGVLMQGTAYYYVGVFDGTTVSSERLDARVGYETVMIGAMDYDGDGQKEISVVEQFSTYASILIYELDLTKVVDRSDIFFNSVVKSIFYLDIDYDDPDEIVANLVIDSKYVIRILDNNFTVLYDGAIAGTVYSVAGYDVDNDKVSELTLSMSGLQYLNRRTVYIELISPEVPAGIYGIVDWRGYVLVKWKIYSEDPVSAVYVTVDSKTIATLTDETNEYNITFSAEGRYTIQVSVTTTSGLTCSVSFWYEYNTTIRSMPLEVNILTPNPNQEIQGPILISGTAQGPGTVNVTVKIDNNIELEGITIKPVATAKYYWQVEWDPFGLVGRHTITVIASNETHTSAPAIVTVEIVRPEIYMWADLDGNPDPTIVGTFLPNVSVPNTFYVKVAWPASYIKGVTFIYNGNQIAGTYDAKRNLWYVTLDMGSFPTDTYLTAVVEGQNGNTLQTSVKIEIMELPLWVLELVERYTKGAIKFYWDSNERAYEVETDVISLLDFLKATGILSKLGIDFTIPKEIPVFGEKMTILNLGVIVGFKLYITKYLSMWAKAQLSGQILDKGITVGLYIEGLFNDELELVKLIIDAVFGVTNLVKFTYQHIIPFEVAGIPIHIRLGVTFAVDAFVHGAAVIDGNWSIESFLIDFNPVIKAGAWVYVDVALGLVSVGVIASPTVDIHGIYKKLRDESMWKISATLTIPYKVVLSLFFDAIKTEILSGTLGPWYWEKTSDNWRVADNAPNTAVINMEPFMKKTLLQHADIVSNGDQALAVWVHGEELAYAIYNGFEWSDVDLLTYDGYPKSNPTAIPLNDGRWMVVWTQMDKSRDLSTLRLYYSILDGNGWTIPQRVTNADSPEGYPKAVLVGDKVYLVYLEDSDKNLDTKDWILRYTVFDGESWSEPKMITSVVPVVSPDVEVLGDKVYVAFVTDSDSFTTPEGQKLYVVDLDGESVVLAEDTLVSSPAITAFGGGLKVAWVESTNDDEGIATYTLKVATIVDMTMLDTVVVTTGNYRIGDPEFVVKSNELRLFWITTEKGADGDVASAVYTTDGWRLDLTQDDDKALWSQEYTTVGSWMGVLSEPYTIGIHIVAEGRQWYLVTDSVPTEGTPERYEEPKTTSYGGSDVLVYIVLSAPFGVIVGLLGALISLSRKRRYLLAQ